MSDYLYELTLSYADGHVDLSGSSKLPDDEAIALIARTAAPLIEALGGAGVERIWDEDRPVKAVFTARMEGDEVSLKINPVDGDDSFDALAIAVRAAQFVLDQNSGADA